jgi:hypothetical protein
MSNGVITPTIGDYDSTNNHINRVDTVKSSYDPNFIEVSPKGCIPATVSTQLQYSIGFENTVNDTAHNTIYDGSNAPNFDGQDTQRFLDIVLSSSGR